MSEEEAISKFGRNNLQIYHQPFIPLEWNFLEEREEQMCYSKIIVKKDTQKVLGFHYVGPDAGEVMVGYGVALRMGATYADLLHTVGIHPTNAEELVNLKLTKEETGNEITLEQC